MNWLHIKTIFQKEILDTIRDRKTLYVMILLPLILMPLLMVGMQALMKSNLDKEKESMAKVAVRGYQGRLIGNILNKASKIEIVKEKEVKNDFKSGKINAAILVPVTFEDDLKAKKQINVKIIYDATSQSSSFAKAKIDMALQSFTNSLINTNLIEKGIDPNILNPLTIAEDNVAGEEKMGALILATILPLIIAMWSVIGGMYTAIDIGAGEKERETLEALLVSPASRLSIVLGKFFTILFVTMVTIVLVLLSLVVTYKLAMPYLSLGEQTIKLQIEPLNIILVLIAATLLSAALSALLLTLSISARNFKQAQNYITPLYILNMIPSYILMTMPDFKASVTMYLIPIFNSIVIFKELLMGEVHWDHFGLVMLSSLLFAVAAIILAIRIFNNEKVLFKN
jgi:sodium transport system permease protein